MSTRPDPVQQLGKAELGSGVRPTPWDVIAGLTPDDSSLFLAIHGTRPQAAPNGFNLAFRQEIAGIILDVLGKAYVTQRPYVTKEAEKRNLSVEHLLAAYLVRRIMDKVDQEYV